MLVDENDQDDLAFLDAVDTGLSLDQTRALKETFGRDGRAHSGGAARTGQQELDQVTKDLELTLSKYLQTHQPPRSAYTTEDHLREEEDGGGRVERAFGDQLDRMAGVSLTSGGGGLNFGNDDDETSKLISQAREAATLEAKYGTNGEAELKALSSRHEELKKGIQGLSSVRDAQAAQHERRQQTGALLGPPPAAVDMSELRSGGTLHDENPDDWCCRLNNNELRAALTVLCFS